MTNSLKQQTEMSEIPGNVRNPRQCQKQDVNMSETRREHARNMAEQCQNDARII